MMEISDHFVKRFGELVNGYLQRKQLDVHVKLWSNCKLKTKYLTWTFLGQSTADDLLQKLTNTLAFFPLKKIVLL